MNPLFSCQVEDSCDPKTAGLGVAEVVESLNQPMKIQIDSNQNRLCLAMKSLIAIIVLLFVSGDIFNVSRQLNPGSTLISKYAVSASDHILFEIVITLTGMLVFLFAYSLLSVFHHKAQVRLSSMVMTIAAICFCFTALYQTAPITDHWAFYRFLNYHFPNAFPLNPADIEFRANVHDLMIFIAGASMLSSMAILGVLFSKTMGHWRGMGRWSFVLLISSSLFMIGMNIAPFPGISETLSFLAIFIWMWLVVDKMQSDRDVLASEGH